MEICVDMLSDLELNDLLFNHTNKLKNFCSDLQETLRLFKDDLLSEGLWDYSCILYINSGWEVYIASQHYDITLKARSVLLERALAEVCLLALDYKSTVENSPTNVPK